MQADPITLSVDLANTGTTTDKVFVRFDGEGGNRSTYVGPGHTPSSRNMMQMYRTFAVRSGQFLGSEKTNIKFTQDVSVPNADGSGNIVAPMIIEASASFPVGTTAAQKLAFRQHLIAILDRDDVAGPLHEIQEI